MTAKRMKGVFLAQYLSPGDNGAAPQWMPLGDGEVFPDTQAAERAIRQMAKALDEECEFRVVRVTKRLSLRQRVRLSLTAADPGPRQTCLPLMESLPTAPAGMEVVLPLDTADGIPRF